MGNLISKYTKNMTDAKEEMKQRYMSAEDKAAVKKGVKTGCQKCKNFGQKFSELIFIVALLAASALNIIWAFFVTDAVLCRARLPRLERKQNSLVLFGFF